MAPSWSDPAQYMWNRTGIVPGWGGVAFPVGSLTVRVSWGAATIHVSGARLRSTYGLNGLRHPTPKITTKNKSNRTARICIHAPSTPSLVGGKWCEASNPRTGRQGEKPAGAGSRNPYKARRARHLASPVVLKKLTAYFRTTSFLASVKLRLRNFTCVKYTPRATCFPSLSVPSQYNGLGPAGNCRSATVLTIRPLTSKTSTRTWSD